MNPIGEVIPQLRGPDIKLLHAAVIASYDYQGLKQDLFYELDKRLELISADGNFETVVFQVLDAARRCLASSSTSRKLSIAACHSFSGPIRGAAAAIDS